jgi:hypothetical protein
MMLYLADLRDVCGNLFEPVFCLLACFLLISLGTWSLLAIGRIHRGAQAASAVAFGVVLVAGAVPCVVFSEAWITCSLSDSASRSAALTPPSAFRKASLTPRFPFI